ncbi:MAG: hypothetical protein H6Q86_3993, partial [candidate division NC10 bacterium]|nr:hypothetical protein [candidate division NC10 bacterium]
MLTCAAVDGQSMGAIYAVRVRC